MALRVLKTSLRSNKFEEGNKPYIVTPLPQGFTDPFEGPNQIKVTAAGFSHDFPVRGGALSLINSATDSIRIGKFFADLPKGPLFIAKQIGLQLSNPKIETGRTLFTNNNRLYNGGLNTLAQIPVNAFGVHFDRSGLGPIIQDQNKYEAVVSLKNIDTPNENRLVKLFNDKIVIGSSETIINNKLEKLVSNLNKSIPKSGILGGVQRAFIRNIENVKRDLNPQYYLIDEYKGGPDSLYGIGTTTIKRYYFSDNPRTENFDIINPRKPDIIVGAPSLFVSQYKDPNDATSLADIKPLPQSEKYTNNKGDNVNSAKIGPVPNNSHLNSLSYNYDMLAKQKIADYGEEHFGLIGKDFRKKINNELGGGDFSVLPQSNYTSKEVSMITRIGIGDPGKISRDRRRVNIKDVGTEDDINMMPLFKDAPIDRGGWVVNVDGKLRNSRDLIKFYIEAVDNDNPYKWDSPKDDSTTKIMFRAFVSSFDDNYSPDWQPHKYVGRGENFYTYQGFDRKISISFKIAAQSRAEMKPLYQKLNYLVSNTAPDYNQQGFMRGPFMVFTLGTWIYRQPTVITSLNLSWKDGMPWEISMDRPEAGDDDNMTELPQVMDVNMSMNVIHGFVPRKGHLNPFIHTGPYSKHYWLHPSDFPKL